MSITDMSLTVTVFADFMFADPPLIRLLSTCTEMRSLETKRSGHKTIREEFNPRGKTIKSLALTWLYLILDKNVIFACHTPCNHELNSFKSLNQSLKGLHLFA